MNKYPCTRIRGRDPPFVSSFNPSQHSHANLRATKANNEPALRSILFFPSSSVCLRVFVCIFLFFLKNGGTSDAAAGGHPEASPTASRFPASLHYAPILSSIPLHSSLFTLFFLSTPPTFSLCCSPVFSLSIPGSPLPFHFHVPRVQSFVLRLARRISVGTL